MVAMNLSNNTMTTLLHKLFADFPALTFQAGAQFCWSPKDRQVIFRAEAMEETLGGWSLLHEVGHALLDHSTYTSDFELLQMEAAAWEEARKLAHTYGYDIDPDHIQDCLDTYRDWLHRRSTCPACGNRSLQENARTYACFNCSTKWNVSASRFCRPYRRIAISKQQLAVSHTEPIKSPNFR